MKDRGKISISPRMKLAGVFAGIAIFFAIINLLPLERPFFPADDSIFTASRYFEAGDCKAGYDVYEKRAANNKVSPAITYLLIGDMKYNGECGGQDIPGAIAAYRKAARLGNCQANFELAGVAFLHPSVPGVEQLDYKDNLFVTTLCAYYANDQEIVSLYFDNNYADPGFERLKEPFREALVRREQFKKLPPEQQMAIRQDIIEGKGFDANPSVKP